MNDEKVLLVGDNPFHGVSHLSQERATSRGEKLTNPSYAAELVITSVENGADGFMFTVSETTLSILRIISRREEYNQLQLYAIVPYTYEFVRSAPLAGGIPGLARKLAKEIASSRNWRAVVNGVTGIITTTPTALLRSYLIYEVFRLKSAAGKRANLVSLLLHELVTDMALALNMDWLFRMYIDFVSSVRIKPGFETRNFPCLVQKFKEWGIDFNGIVMAAPFNSIGFQMCPSREKCEEALAEIPEAEVIAFSILAAGYLKLPEAIEYVVNLPNLKGVAVGASKECHVRQTFNVLKKRCKCSGLEL
ncbi:hypothetical protein DRO69_06120 [Candidatus Bathyarchaeota archaeon]|nr:MAG: hypothetical protein DRO69_06120 [Candidatus Bathyarchaeota archaeon]